MTRIVYSSDVFEMQRYGGVSRYFVELAQQISCLEAFEVRVASAIHINSFLKRSNLNSGFYLPFSPHRLRADNLIRHVNKLHSTSISSKQLFDIRHETFFKGGVNSLSARKTVTTIYDLTREKFTPNWHGFEAKQKSLSQADAIICISNSAKNDLLNFYKVNPEKLSVIHLGVSNIFKNDLSLVKNFRQSQQLLYVGARNGYKDFKTLLLAFSKSSILRNNLKVLVLGSKFTKDEEKLMESLGIRNNFNRKSACDQILVDALKNSIALIITSIYEGFGLTVLEAMLSGCPVVSTGGGSLGEVAGGFDVNFEPSEPESLTAAIISVVDKTFPNNSSIKKAQKYAEAFTWEQTAFKTRDIYTNLLL